MNDVLSACLSQEVWGMGMWVWAVGFPQRIGSRGGLLRYLLPVLYYSVVVSDIIGLQEVPLQQMC